MKKIQYEMREVYSAPSTQIRDLHSCGTLCQSGGANEDFKVVPGIDWDL